MNATEYYQNVYSKIVYDGITGRIARRIHLILEKNPAAKDSIEQILEVGAGNGQHHQFVKNNYQKYFETDIKKTFLQKKDPKSNPTLGKVIQSKVDAENLTIFSDSVFDRVIATCLLIHLSAPELALQEWRRVTKSGGWISIYIPCEPGILLRIARHYTTVRKSKKLNRNHLSFHYREHISYFSRLNLLVAENFTNDSIKRIFFPFILPVWNLNLGVIYQIQVNKLNDSIKPRF